MLRPQEDALGVDGHHVVPYLLSGLQHALGAKYRGVVDQDVELAEPLDRGLYGMLPICFLCYV